MPLDRIQILLNESPELRKIFNSYNALPVLLSYVKTRAAEGDEVAVETLRQFEASKAKK